MDISGHFQCPDALPGAIWSIRWQEDHMDHPALHTSCCRGPLRRSSWDSAASSYPWSAQTLKPAFRKHQEKRLVNNFPEMTVSDNRNTPKSNGVSLCSHWKLMFWGWFYAKAKCCRTSHVGIIIPHFLEKFQLAVTQTPVKMATSIQGLDYPW